MGDAVITWPVLADAVRECATRPAGSVHVTGRPGGLIRLRAGAVVGTWTSGTPLAVPSPDPATRSAAASASPLARLAMTDAVFVMAAGRVSGWRAEDDPSAAGEGISMDLEALLVEVDRRMRRVTGPDGLLSPEETVVRGVSGPGDGQLMTTPGERHLLESLTAAGDAVRTVRDLAFAAGRGVFAVLLDVQRLAAMGAVSLTTHPLAEPPPPALLVQARSSLDPPAVAAVEAALQRRRQQLADSTSTSTSAAPPVPDPPAAPVPPSREPVPTGPTDQPHLRAVPGGLAQRVPGATNAARARRLPWQPRRPAAHQAPEYAVPDHVTPDRPGPAAGDAMASDRVARARAALDRAAAVRFGVDPAESDRTVHDGPAHDGPAHDGPAHDGPAHEPAGRARPSHAAPDHRQPDRPDPDHAVAHNAVPHNAVPHNTGTPHVVSNHPSPDRPVRDRMEGRP